MNDDANNTSTESGALTIQEQMAYATTRVLTYFPDRTVGTGTAFFYTIHCSDDRQLPLLVTNKHVVEGGKTFSVTLNLADTSVSPAKPDIGNFETVKFDGEDFSWRFHPDASVDLAAIPLKPFLENGREKDTPYFTVHIDSTNFLSTEAKSDLLIMENIVFVGYPNGWWDDAWNQPVMRVGTTATSVGLPYCNKPLFLIDAAVFPGSSGSPVFLFNEGIHASKKGVNIGGTRIAFIGVVFGVGLNSVEGSVEFHAVPTGLKMISKADVPNHLGLVLQAELIEDFKPVFLATADGEL